MRKKIKRRNIKAILGLDLGQLDLLKKRSELKRQKEAKNRAKKGLQEQKAGPNLRFWGAKVLFLEKETNNSREEKEEILIFLLIREKDLIAERAGAGTRGGLIKENKIRVIIIMRRNWGGLLVKIGFRLAKVLISISLGSWK